MASVRKAAKAGSWYESDGDVLDKQLTGWLSKAEIAKQKRCQAIIGPHAGYSYSGPTAAWSYLPLMKLSGEPISRIILLGPSHHAYLEKCGLTQATEFETPLGNIPIDTQVIQELYKTNLFQKLTRKEDEQEHSLELHLPYIYKCFYQDRKDVPKLVPIMVGGMSTEYQEEIGKLLSKFLEDPQNLFIVSSDFCHWGERFSYTRYDKKCGPIYKSIEVLDHEGMQTIETMDPSTFKQYLSKTKNTICGRYPISLLLHTIQECKNVKYSLEFVHYEQSNKCVEYDDSSVSYAAGVLYRE